jgi:hypothetical protein
MQPYYTPASILAALTPETLTEHVAGLKAHLASRAADHPRLTGGAKASNSKVMNQLKREIAALG